jgi:hypothetical protein
MRLPVPPREQRGAKDASTQPSCKSEFQKNTRAQLGKWIMTFCEEAADAMLESKKRLIGFSLFNESTRDKGV